MKPTHIMIMAYLGFLMLTAPSCLVLSNPVSDPFQAEPDLSLFGNWKAEAPGRWADQLTIGQYSPSGTIPEKFPLSLMSIDRVKRNVHGKSVATNNVRLLCFPTRIADTRYLNMAIVTPENEQTLLNFGWDEDRLVYIVFKYRVEGDKLHLQVMDLRGKPTDSKTRSLARGTGRYFILANPENLVELLASKKGDEYFRKEVVFTRTSDQKQPLAVALRDHAL